jgi:ubiquinone biosynthesis protein COQ9
MSKQDTDPRSRNDSTRTKLLQAALQHAAFDGWSQASFKTACDDVGISAGEAQIACPRKEIDLITVWSKNLDTAAAQKIIKADLPNMKIRERVSFGVISRLEVIGENEEAARRARARLMLPDAASDGPQLLWATADMIWRAIGDTSTDVNFYSKRTILSAVYGSTLASWLNEDAREKPDARAFLDRRIQNVMDFEKTKAQLSKLTADLPDLVGALGKMRYGPGPRV